MPDVDFPFTYMTILTTQFLLSQPLPAPWPDLSVRERSALLLIGRGFLDKEVASTLGIKLSTAISHKKNAFAKLGLHSRRCLFGFVARYPHLFLSMDTETAADRVGDPSP